MDTIKVNTEKDKAINLINNILVLSIKKIIKLPNKGKRIKNISIFFL